MVHEIPKNAKAVYKGIRFTVYHWRQKLLDGSYATFEGVKRRDTVRVLPVVGRSILIAKEWLVDGKIIFGTFGGLAEDGERPLSVGKRELLEESGYVSDDWKLACVEIPPESWLAEYKVYVFIARNCRKVARQKLDRSEKIEVRSVTLGQLLRMSAKWGPFETSILRDARLNPKARKKLQKMLFGTG